jgi:hypothetical protein
MGKRGSQGCVESETTMVERFDDIAEVFMKRVKVFWSLISSPLFRFNDSRRGRARLHTDVIFGQNANDTKYPSHANRYSCSSMTQTWMRITA